VESPPPPSAAAAAGQTKAAARSAYHNQLICTTATPTGSHIAKRRCRTQEQIDAEREEAKKALRDAQDATVTAGGSSLPIEH
jgi:hypothetical protein